MEIPGLPNKVIISAVMKAKSEVDKSGILNSELRLQTNTICAVFHNFICKTIEELSNNWKNFSDKYTFPDLIGPKNAKLDIKTSQTPSDLVGNKSFGGTDFFVIGINFSVADGKIKVRLIRIGFLKNTDWIKGKGETVQFSKLSKKARLIQIYP